MKQHFIPKKKVLIIFNDGHQETGKIKKAEKGILTFFDRKPVEMKQVRAVAYYKPQ